MLLLTLLKNLGPKLLGFAVLALVVFLSITWVNHKIVENTIQEQRIESLEKEIYIRRKVDDILQESRESNPDRNGSRRTDLPGITDTSCYWYCRTDRIKSIRK